MRRNLFFYEILFFLLANGLMFILHDAYKDTGIMALSYISAVNESVFEHAKIVFYALFFAALLEYLLVGKAFNNYWMGKFVALLVGPVLMIILFYTYSGILGYNILWMDILIGVISIAVAQWISYRIIRYSKRYVLNNVAWFLLIIGLMVIISLLTYDPIKIDLFKDSTTGKYGI